MAVRRCAGVDDHLLAMAEIDRMLSILGAALKLGLRELLLVGFVDEIQGGGGLTDPFPEEQRSPRLRFDGSSRLKAITLRGLILGCERSIDELLVIHKTEIFPGKSQSGIDFQRFVSLDQF